MSEILQNQVKKQVSFKTVVHFKNGAKETVFHVKAPAGDGSRFLHFGISDSEGVAFNMDEVRKFETWALVQTVANIIT